MRTTRVLIPLATTMLLAACSSGDGGSVPLATDPPSGVAPATGSSDPRVQAYIDAQYDRGAVRHSFTTSKGDVIDCADFASEPGVRALIAKGTTVDDLLANIRTHEASRSAASPVSAPLAEGECPASTVPHRRITAERIAAAGGLEAFEASLRHARPTEGPDTIARGPVVTPDANPAPGGTWPYGDVANYGHVFSYQTASSVTGGQSTMAIGPTSIVSGSFVNHSTNHSLAQIWIVGGTGAATQTLEVGWEIDATNGGPYLFVSSTQDDYKDYCQNGSMAWGTTSCVTWVPNPGTAVYPGSPLPASVSGGAQHDLTVQVTHNCYIPIGGNNCNWDIDVWVDGAGPTFLGYFPDSGYGTGALGNGVGSVFETGGEVDDGSGNFTEVSMGEGSMLWGWASYGETAYVHDFGYFANSCFRTIDPRYCANPLIQTGDTVYTTQPEFTYNTTAPAGSSGWSNWFYYGNYRSLIIRRF